MRRLLAIGGALALAACGGDTTTIETEDGSAEYDTSGSDGDAEIRFTDKDGNETVMSSGSDAAVDLPDGFTLYPGASVASNTVISGGAGEGMMVGFTSSAAAEELATHYRREAEAAGFEIQIEMNSGETVMIGGEGPEGGFFSLNSSPDGDGSSAMLIVGKQ